MQIDGHFTDSYMFKARSQADPHQRGTIVRKQGTILAEFEVRELPSGQCFISIISTLHRKKLPAVEIMLVQGHDGGLWAIDGEVNRIDANGLHWQT